MKLLSELFTMQRFRQRGRTTGNPDFGGPATSRRSSLIQMATTLRRHGEAHEVHAAVPGSGRCGIAWFDDPARVCN
jgi:hypothetical protein